MLGYPSPTFTLRQAQGYGGQARSYNLTPALGSSPAYACGLRWAGSSPHSRPFQTSDTLGSSQAVRHLPLEQACGGSNPSSPAIRLHDESVTKLFIMKQHTILRYRFAEIVEQQCHTSEQVQPKRTNCLDPLLWRRRIQTCLVDRKSFSGSCKMGILWRADQINL
jgi:hypothetical protein